MPLVIVAIGVVLLLLLMIRFKMNGFIALVLVALAVGLMQGMPLDKVIGSIKAGVGGTLGSLALIMGFGAMLGKMLADCGGAQRIATTLIAKFGKKHIQWAVVLTGFTVGFALFYEVGFVLMLPLVFTIAASANIPLLYVGVPMAAALSVTHGFLPPHPGPTAIATIFNADMGKTLLYLSCCSHMPFSRQSAAISIFCQCFGIGILACQILQGRLFFIIISKPVMNTMLRGNCSSQKTCPGR